jgi:predicted lipoprotein with Yx(FWY)xxD motif
MKSLLFSLGAIVLVLSLVVGVAVASAASTSPSAAAKVSVASTRLGRVLVDGRGHTLYLFAKDTREKSTCNGACAAFWPPLIAARKPLAGRACTRRGSGRQGARTGACR